MKFWAIDVETANESMTSICQIGLVRFENGVEVSSSAVLVNPGTHFSSMNTMIHGLTEQHVASAPPLSVVWPDICRLVEGEFTVCHTHFDRVALSRAAEASSLQDLRCIWLDSAKVARRAWPEFRGDGYGLKSLASKFGIEFAHHDAMHDARACGYVLVQAITATGLDPAGWIERCKTGVGGSTGAAARSPADDGMLSGETLVFTGALTLTRSQAADMAARAGARVTSSVSKKTTMLIVGDQDAAKLAGADRSSKHRAAEALIAEGYAIKLLTESDFMNLTRSGSQSAAG